MSSLPSGFDPAPSQAQSVDLHPFLPLSESTGKPSTRRRHTVVHVTESQDSLQATTATGPDSASTSQAEIDDEIAGIRDDYERAGADETQPRLDYPPYRSSLLRHPTKDLHHADPETIELLAPVFGHRDVGAAGVRPDHPAQR